MIAREKLSRVLGIMRKEFRQVFRDERMSRLLFVSPVIQLLVFGYAVSTDVRNVRMMVVDHSHTAESRALVDALTSGGYFRVAERSDRSDDLMAALDRGRVTMGIEIPPDYARRLGNGDARVQLLVDGTNSNVATVALGYAEQIVQQHGLSTLAEPPPKPVDLRERAWFNPDLQSRNYNVPGVVATIMLMITMMLTALSVVRERELGTLEQLMVSPMTPGELIAGKTLPFAIIALFDMVVITVIALLWFHVPFLGQAPVLLLGAVLFLLSTLGLGLLISTVSNTQQEAFLTTFLVIMPTMMLSGFMFPVTSMQTVFQWFTLLNPLRHYLEIVRAVFLKGAGIDALWRQFVMLFVMGSLVLWFAGTRFHKTVR